MDASYPPKLLDNVYGRRVQGDGCPKASGVRKFFIGNIDGRDDRSEPLRDLHGEVAQAADAEDRQTLTWLDVGVPQGTIDRDSRTEKRRSVDAGEPVGDLDRKSVV